MSYKTKTTWLGTTYGCQIYKDSILIVEGRCKFRNLIGATFRDLFSTLDTLGGDVFTHSVRRRKFKVGNPVINTKHYWNGKNMGNAQADAQRTRTE